MEQQTYTPEQVQAAKDFIWDNMDENGKDSMVLFSTTDSLKSNGLMLDKIHPYISVNNFETKPPIFFNQWDGGIYYSLSSYKIGERVIGDEKSYESYPFPVVEKKVDEITPLLSGLTLSQIEMVLDKVKNRCYLYPIKIE